MLMAKCTMKLGCIYYVSLFISVSAFGQFALPKHQYDSLTQLLTTNPHDTIKFELYMQLGIANSQVNPDKAVLEYHNALKVAQKMNDTPRIMGCLTTLAFLYSHTGQSPKSIEMLLQVLRFAEERNEDTSMALAFIGINYEAQGDYKNALHYTRRANTVYEELRKNKKIQIDERGYVAGPHQLGVIYEKINQLDSALHYALMSYQRISEKPLDNQFTFFYCQICNLLGTIYSRLNNADEASRFFYIALNKAKEVDYPIPMQESQVGLANYYLIANKLDSAIFYAIPAYDGAKKNKGFKIMQKSTQILRLVYEKKGLFDKALYFNDLSIAARVGRQHGRRGRSQGWQRCASGEVDVRDGEVVARGRSHGRRRTELQRAGLGWQAQVRTRRDARR